jgi:hypothetical protein
MEFIEAFDSDILVITSAIYVLLSLSIAVVGSYKKCGGKKALFFSMALTPITGILYVLSSPEKNTLKIVHYRCTKCGLEFTDNHRHCPSCKLDGKKSRLERYSMRTY